MQLKNISNTPKEQNYRHNNNAPSFQAKQKTFVMLKPDCFEKGFENVIVEILENNDFKIIKSWEGIAPREKLINNYIHHQNKHFFNDWMDFLQSGNVKAMEVEGEDAVVKVRELAMKIRKLFAPNQKRQNIIHTSDSQFAALRERANFFVEA